MAATAAIVEVDSVDAAVSFDVNLSTNKLTVRDKSETVSSLSTAPAAAIAATRDLCRMSSWEPCPFCSICCLWIGF